MVVVHGRYAITAVAALLAVGVTLFAWGETMQQAAAAASRQIENDCRFSCAPIAAPNPVFAEAELLGVAIVVAAIVLGAFMVRAARRKTAVPA